MYSIYRCENINNLIELIKSQPNTAMFYKSNHDFYASNLVSVLAFISKGVAYLLQDKFSEHFSEDYPLFYKNKIPKRKHNCGPSKILDKKKYYYCSPIKIAISQNKIGAVISIIDYIVKYQNSYISSYMFNSILPRLYEKGVEVSKLLCSKVFEYEIELVEWPMNHSSLTECIKPYNKSIFELKHHYGNIFNDEEFKLDPDSSKKKMYKISYTLTLLPSISVYVQEQVDPDTGKVTRVFKNEGTDILSLCNDSEELTIYESRAL